MGSSCCIGLPPRQSFIGKEVFINIGKHAPAIVTVIEESKDYLYFMKGKRKVHCKRGCIISGDKNELYKIKRRWRKEPKRLFITSSSITERYISENCYV